MILFHGSNVEINRIDLSICQVGKDFGCGFYLTDLESQARQMAERRVRITKQGTAIVTSFLFDMKIMDEALSVKLFDRPTKEWALFILANRNNEERRNRHSYDIVIGPVADDGVAYQLERYEQGMIELSVLTQELTFPKLNNQYFFGTEKAISLLNRL